MNERIKFLRKDCLKLTRQAFAEKLNVSASIVEKWEYGEREITERTLQHICKTFKVSYHWLAYGVEPMYESSDQEAQAIVNRFMDSDNEIAKALFTVLAKQDAEFWKMAVAFGRELLDEINKNK